VETVTISRRALLLGGGAAGLAALGGAYALVEQDVLPGRIRLNQALEGLPLVGDDPPEVPGGEPGPVVTGSFFSEARGTEVGWTVAYPSGFDEEADLPVSLLLHGRDEDHTWMFDDLSLQYFLAHAVTAEHVPPFALASVDGGSATNWHPRASGDDPQGMVVDEFVPLLAARGLRTDRIGLWGWSLGGFGALLLATELGAKRVAAVVATSPALWLAPEDTAPDVFDDPQDYQRNDVFSRVGELQGLPLRIDIGDDDSFTPNVEAFIDVLPTAPAGGVGNGFHDAAYWMRVAPDEIAFLGNHLA
jgi:S-formylglutathione hydrolase FrmB